MFLNVALQGRLAVDEGGHDVTIARVAGLHHHHVTFVDLGVDHTVATHL